MARELKVIELKAAVVG